MCVFCLEYGNPAHALRFLPAGWPFPDRILLRNAEAFAVPGYGPQVYPYVLVLPRRHSTSMACCSIRERRAVLEIIGELSRHPAFSAGMTIFEHGGCDPISSCMEHSHFHLISAEVNLRCAHLPKGCASGRFSFNAMTLPSGGRYLFLGTYHTGEIAGCFQDGSGLPSQFFRRRLAEVLGVQEFDWRIGMNTDFMLQMRAGFDRRSES